MEHNEYAEIDYRLSPVTSQTANGVKSEKNRLPQF